jgi:hypothetical protein
MTTGSFARAPLAELTDDDLMRMGHATISITLDRYGHLVPGSEDDAASPLDAYLNRAEGQARIASLAA